MSEPTLRLLYFAWLRERVGRSEETFGLPAEVTTVAALRALLAARGGGFAALAEGGSVRCAVNQDLAGPATPVGPGDEVAFFPPVTGG
jgi:molybdopterin synthase sulfur carrier subunit